MPGVADPPIAEIGSLTITQSQIVRPLLDGYGLKILLDTVTLDLAKQEAASRGITVTQQDIDGERDKTLSEMFGDVKKEDYPQLLQQFLDQKQISQTEFDVAIQTNAYLRKIARPMVDKSITDDRLEESFKAVYGEKVLVRHIQCANMQEINEAKRKLAAGESFADVAKEMSRNPNTGPLGGELPPFSRYADYPEVFKDAAFSLKEGEVSDSVESGGIYHLIKLEKRIAPKAVKFDDVKQSLREDLVDRLSQTQIKEFRTQLVNRIEQQLKVDDPELARQYELKKNPNPNEVHGKKDAPSAIKRDEGRAAQEAGGGLPPELYRPPATLPGYDTPGHPSTAPTAPSPSNATTRP